MSTLATTAGPSPVRTWDRTPSRTNGPAAILAARTGDATVAAAITDWIADSLVDPQTGLQYRSDQPVRHVLEAADVAALRELAHEL